MVATEIFNGPPQRFVVGNLFDIDPKKPVQSLCELSKQYNGAMRVRILNSPTVYFLTSQELVAEVCDESRFDKRLHTVLQNVRPLGGDGLFTAETAHPDWGKAHRVLMPVFGPAALRNMFPGMLDIAEQLMLKWERLGPETPLEVSDNMTRLTLDAIALCAFNYRFNSFYKDNMHPFVDAMVRALLEAGNRGRRLPIANWLRDQMDDQNRKDLGLLRSISDGLIDERKAKIASGATVPDDILNVMLNATDPKTGERLSEANVRDQMITFLIAGHETTSGLLTFAIYELLRHPEILTKAQEEADRVLGTAVPKFEHVQQLDYISRVLKETLRLWPTAPAFAVYSKDPETIIGGKYKVTKDETLMVLTPMLHRDPKVWEDPEKFDPDRFIFENFQKLPPHSWKPFGNGQRACIGRPFALQEATLVLGMLLRRFDIKMADPEYKLDVMETLTMKPHGLFIHAIRRDTVVNSALPSESTAKPAESATKATPATTAPPVASTPIRVAYGSNAGSAEAFARKIASDASKFGYSASIGTMDSLVADGSVHLAQGGPLVVVTASYEGKPPDNARKFVEHLENLQDGSLEGLKFAVFGVGNPDWARTYQAIPKLVDAALERVGGTRIVARGEADARGDFYGDFDSWYSTFWAKVDSAVGKNQTEPKAIQNKTIEIEFVKPVRDPLLRQNGLATGTIVENRELVDMTSKLGRSKRHVEIELPEGMTYRTGDYLAVLPLNPPEQVDRVLRRYGLEHDTQIIIRPGDEDTMLPTDQPVAVGEILSAYVELAIPATRSQIEVLAQATRCPPEKEGLLALIADSESYLSKVLNKRVSLLDLLERYRACELPLAKYLAMLPVLKPRQYSISSSPLWNANHCTLTVAVVEAPALSGQGTYYGVASNYLKNSKPGTRVAVTIRPSQAAFHPPESLDVPIIMACAGTGVAPFHGFLQDRALRVAAAGGFEVAKPAPAVLFFGCDHPDVDYLYRSELEEWEKQGLVRMRPAFTFAPEDGVMFVQHRIWKEREEIIELVTQGAIFFVCGDGQRMAPAVHETCRNIYVEATQKSTEEADAWMEEMERGKSRYVADVFA